MVGFTFASRAFSFFFVFDYSGFTFKSACLDEVPRPPRCPDPPPDHRQSGERWAIICLLSRL